MNYLYDFSKCKIKNNKEKKTLEEDIKFAKHLPYLLSDLKNGLLVLKDDFFYEKEIADRLFNELKRDVIYDKKSVIKMGGRTIPIPRKQTAYGDPGTSYNFSGTSVAAKQWIPVILRIKNDIEDFTGKKFNFCLVNYYENGNNYISYHKDDEQDLGPKPCIASVTFGQERYFYFKSDNKDLPVVKTTLPHGSLCLMLHPTNIYWKHSVPKQSVNKVPNPRLNLTFRWIELQQDVVVV